LPDVNFLLKASVLEEVEIVFGALGDWSAADTIAARFFREVQGVSSPWVRIQAANALGRTRGMLRDFPEADQLLSGALRELQSLPYRVPVLEEVVRLQLTAVVARRGDQPRRADSLFALLPPRQAAELRVFVAGQRQADRAAMDRRAQSRRGVPAPGR
jgi:hypothetical protein